MDYIKAMFGEVIAQAGLNLENIVGVLRLEGFVADLEARSALNALDRVVEAYQTHRRIQQPQLLFLVYATNICYTNVVDEQPEEIAVDLPRGEWTLRGKTHAIGSMHHHESSSRGGTIGVYYKDNMSHLNAMFHHAQEATRSQGSLVDDD